MRRYQVENRFTDRVYGVYEAGSEDEALDACARDQGYGSYADAMQTRHRDVTATNWVARWLPQQIVR
jgi:hypothetical protein